jgi:hypothetical protein
MPTDAELIFAEHAARLYAKHHGFPPMAGCLLGYLAICDPAEQTIDELAEFLNERLPQVAAEWRERRAALRASGQLTGPHQNRR